MAKYISPTEVVRTLWESGTAQLPIYHFRSMAWTLNVVARHPKGLVARVDIPHPKATPGCWNIGQNSRLLVYVPSPEDVVYLSNSSRYTIRGAPGRSFPGMVDYCHYNVNEKSLSLVVQQGCYLQGRGGVTRSIATRHGGARRHCVEYILSVALESGLNVVKNYIASPQSRAMFKEMAESLGWQVATIAEYRSCNSGHFYSYQHAIHN